jgi:2-polyprenyl-6-methoxyphenol hydroxylase-like FAD-dependent oxidoreductase
MEFPWDEDGVKAGIGGNDADLLAHWPGLLYDNTRDYVMWGFSAAAPKFPPDLLRRRGGDLVRVVQAMTEDWHPQLRELFWLTDPSTCFPINIRTSVPIRPWPSSNVTLLGDAIHPMTPDLSQGAAQALEDAVVLAAALRDAADPVTGLRAYEAARRRRTAQIVSRSHAAGRLAQSSSALGAGVRDLLIGSLPNRLHGIQQARVVDVELPEL